MCLLCLEREDGLRLLIFQLHRDQGREDGVVCLLTDVSSESYIIPYSLRTAFSLAAKITGYLGKAAFRVIKPIHLGYATIGSTRLFPPLSSLEATFPLNQ